MSKWSREPEEIYRDVLVALFHPEYRDGDAIDALRELKERRRA